MPSGSRILVFDIGGTSTRQGIVNARGKLFKTKKWDTPTYRNSGSTPVHLLPQLLIDRIVNAMPGRRLDGIGISFAGPVTPRGTVVRAPNIWGSSIANFPLAEEIATKTGVPTTVVNDMTAAAWREKMFGKAAGLSSFQIITVSSGIGSKVFANGQVIIGENGEAGEIGHLVIDPTSRLQCGCGGYGHLESFASGLAAERIAKEMAQSDHETFVRSLLYQISSGNIDNIDNRLIAAAANSADPFTLQVIEAICRPLARTIADLWKETKVEKYFIIGGFALGVGQPYLDTFKRMSNEAGLNGELIVTGTDDDNSGLIGAAAAAFNRLK